MRAGLPDLWVIQLAGDGRCNWFEEWPYWPEHPRSARDDLASAGRCDILRCGPGPGKKAGSRAVAQSKPDVSPAPRRTISGSGWEKSITVVGSVPQSPESITASTT